MSGKDVQSDPWVGIWDRLREVARPDSRLHYDFAHIHPDFEGSAEAVRRLFEEGLAIPPRLAFVVPDGAALAAREALLRMGCRVVVSTYCMRRGFRLLDPATIAPANRAFAATLDGAERFGVALDLAALAGLGRFDLMVTGCAAVAENGSRFGRSYQYFDIEWGLLAELGLVGEQTPIAVIAHDVQLVPARLAPMPGEAVPDMIATPSRLLHVTERPRRPSHVLWDRIDPEEIELVPALVELERARGQRR